MTAELQIKVAQWAENYALEKGWVLNPDPKQRGAVIKGLAHNTKKFGAAYCPCRIRSGDPEKDKLIICPCIYHQDELDQAGHCTCNFFYDKET
jgi:ferredoxin-thioredoxin reductase catalytic subunit